MQKAYSRRNRKNEIANLSKRYIGVMALRVIPGGSLPLMATATVFQNRSTASSAIELIPMQVEFQGNPQGSRTKPGCNRGCGLNWHRECVANLIGQLTGSVRRLAGYIAPSLRIGQVCSTGLLGRSPSSTTLPRLDQLRQGSQTV